MLNELTERDLFTYFRSKSSLELIEIIWKDKKYNHSENFSTASHL